MAPQGITPPTMIDWEKTAQDRLTLEDDLNAVLSTMRNINEHPSFRSRRTSLAITNLEQAMHWLDMETKDR